jgi:hypothetical protein
MKLEQVLSQLRQHKIEVHFDHTGPEGDRTIIVGCALPFPYSGRFQYYTMTLAPGEDEISREEREAMKRRLCHLATDIFDEDEDLAELIASGVSDEEPDHLGPPAPYDPDPPEDSN